MTIEPGVFRAPLPPRKVEPMDAVELLNIFITISKDITDLKEAIEWVTTPHPDLGGKRPLDSSWGDVYNLFNKNKVRSA